MAKKYGASVPGLSRKEIGSKVITTAMGKGRILHSNSLQDLAEEEDLYDEQILREKKRRLTPDQEEIAYYTRRPCLHFKVSILEKSFEEGTRLLPERKSQLARKLDLHPRQIAIWFQNRKARWKNKQLERDFNQLKSSYDNLLSDHTSLRTVHDSILHHNQQLLLQVASLNEKLQEKEWNQTLGATMEEANFTSTARESKAMDEMEANVSCTIISQGIVMKPAAKSTILLEQHPNNTDCNIGNQVDVLSIEEDGESRHHHNYMIFKEEQEGINGVCFSEDVYADQSAAFVVEHQPWIQEEEGAGMSWWIWH